MQHYYDTLFDYISLIIDIPEHDRAQSRQTFKPVWVARDTMLEAAGKVPVYHNLIVSGFMRKFYVNDKGEEVTVDLNNGPRFFTSYYHFMRQTVSNEYLYCITDCELLRITMADAESSAKTSFTQKDYTIRLRLKLSLIPHFSHMKQKTQTVAIHLFRNVTRFWFAVTYLGQLIFAYYVFMFYWKSAALGHFDKWNTANPHFYVKGDMVGNLSLAYTWLWPL